VAADPGEGRRSLAALLADYDQANRIAIDSLYAQFSPTLDDFYAETLRITFPVERVALDRLGNDVRPDLLLTRTVPGFESKSVRAQGAPFPLARARALAEQALAGQRTESSALVAQLGQRQAFLRPAQIGGSQVVRLIIEPGGDDVLALLDQP
jgi:hypothetical protein